MVITNTVIDLKTAYCNQHVYALYQNNLAVDPQIFDENTANLLSIESVSNIDHYSMDSGSVQYNL